MMAKQICILAYVITIILILSNAQIISTNKNNQYVTTAATTTTTAPTMNAIERTDIPTVSSTTQQLHANTATSEHAIDGSSSSSTNGLHVDGEFMQRTLHNTNRPIIAEEPQQQRRRPMHMEAKDDDKHSQQFLVQHDTDNAKQLLSSMHDLRQQQHQHTHTHHNHDTYDEHTLTQHKHNNRSEFMNETNKNGHRSTIGSGSKQEKNEQENSRNWTEEMLHSSGNTGNHNESDDSRKSDEMTSMPMKIRDNVNADAKTKVNKSDEVTESNGSDDEFATFKQSEQYPSGHDGNGEEFNERSRYLETDLNFNDDLPFGSIEAADNSGEDNVNDQVSWANDNSRFEELTLDDEEDEHHESNGDDDDKFRLTNSDIPDGGTRKSIIPLATGSQNIFKVSKPNKSKSIKRLAPPQPQALLELRLNKSPVLSTALEKRFIKANSFHHITQLYDQYEWNADDLRNGLSRKCASDMDVYLHELTGGKTWAARASDAAGRYRGQFFGDNNHWVGSSILCEELRNIDEMELGFFIATTLVKSPEPMMKRHVMLVGQCLPKICTADDVKLILNMDASAQKFNQNYINATSEANRGEISVLSVRRVPGEYNPRKDPVFSIIIFICTIFIGITIWATVYENSLSTAQQQQQQQNCHSNTDENPSSPQSLQSVHSQTKLNGQRIYSYENTTIDLESTEPALKMDKVHANNLLNGGTFELHPISMENNNGPTAMMEFTQKNNGNNLKCNNGTNTVTTNNRAVYRLNNNNNSANGNNNNNNYNNHGHNGNTNNATNHNDDNNHVNNRNNFTVSNHNRAIQHRRNGSVYTIQTNSSSEINELSIPQKLLLSFGLSTNIKTILSTKKLPQDSVGCIHGIRVLSMLWIIMVHTYLQTFAISENRFSKKITETKFLFQIVGNASYTVDTFFFLSGFLVTLVFVRSKLSSSKKSKDVSLAAGTKQSIFLIIYRYVRLTPVYFMVIIINTVALKYTYNNAVFSPGLPDHVTCPNYWWRNILYIQTWYPFSQICMLWAWYLADDMQFYVWAIILLIISKRYGKAAVAAIITFLVTSWIVSAMVSLNFNYTHKVAEPLESFGYLYEKPWTRLGPYVMGMLAGYMLCRYKSAPPSITPFINAVLWAMSMCVMFLLVFGVWNGRLNLIWTALYVSLGHTAWGLALVWVVLSCKWGLAKPIDKFLSFRWLLPLSRLTYCAYLVHPVTQIAMSLELKGTIHIHHSLVLTIFLGNTMISYSIALLLSLLFEAPFVRMLKVIFDRK